MSSPIIHYKAGSKVLIYLTVPGGLSGDNVTGITWSKVLFKELTGALTEVGAGSEYDSLVVTEITGNKGYELAFTPTGGSTAHYGLRVQGSEGSVFSYSLVPAEKTGFSMVADQSGVTVGTVNALGTQAKTDVTNASFGSLNLTIPVTPTVGSINDVLKTNLDAKVSNTLAAADYVEPDNTTITKIFKGFSNRMVMRSSLGKTYMTIYDDNDTTPIVDCEVQKSDGSAVDILGISKRLKSTA